MRTIAVVLHDDESVNVEPAVIYMGEHRAVKLEITLPERLKENFDYYTLSFDQMGRGTRVSMGNIYPGDSGDAYCKDGVIHCVLPGRLTHCSFLRVQAEAHRQSGGHCAAVEKSAVFEIAFGDGLAGGGDTLQAFALGHMNALMAELDAFRQQLEMKETLADGDLLGELLDIKAQVEQALGDAETAAGQAAAALSQMGGAITDASDNLMQWMEESMETALSGIGAQDAAAAQGATVTLLPGIRYRITMAGSAVDIVLDDTESSPEFAQEFSFALSVPANVSPAVTVDYLSGAGVAWPTGFAWEEGRIYECSVLDGLALAAEWEAQ